MTEYNENMEELQNGGRLVERFCLLPKKHENQSVTIRLKINGKWVGWRLRDEVVNALELEVGNTITTSVLPQYTCGLSSDVDNMDLFVSGDGIEWLIEHKVTTGTCIDCQVRFTYKKIPSVSNRDGINVACLVFEKGIAVVGIDDTNTEDTSDKESLDDILHRLTEMDGFI